MRHRRLLFLLTPAVAVAILAAGAGPSSAPEHAGHGVEPHNDASTTKPGRCGTCEGLHLEPQLSSVERTARTAADTTLSPSGNFRFAYTTSNDLGDSVSVVDDDANGIPDYIDAAGRFADSILTVFRSMGYTRPIHDGEGYLVRVEDLGAFYGLAYPPSADFPYGWMEVDNDYLGPAYGSQGLDGLRVTLAHEMYHTLQFTYIGKRAAGATWWQECTATFMEEVMYDDVNDYYDYLMPEPAWWGTRETFYEKPSSSLTWSNGMHEYGMAVFPRFLWERHGDLALTAIRHTFVQMENTGSTDRSVIVDALEYVLDRPMRDIVAEFWTWSYFTSSRAREGYFFTEGREYSPSPPYDPVPSKVSTGQWTVANISTLGTITDTVTTQALAGWLTRIIPDPVPGGFSIELWGVDPHRYNWDWEMAVSYPDTIIVYDAPGEGWTFNWDGAEDIVIAAGNDALSGTAVSFGYEIVYQPEAVTNAELERPGALSLGQNMPNPFNPRTVIPFQTSEAGPVELSIYDVTGRLVRTLTSGHMAAGAHRQTWDGTGDDGRAMGSGVYLVRLSAEGRDLVRRMVLAR